MTAEKLYKNIVKLIESKPTGFEFSDKQLFKIGEKSKVEKSVLFQTVDKLLKSKTLKNRNKDEVIYFSLKPIPRTRGSISSGPGIPYPPLTPETSGPEEWIFPWVKVHSGKTTVYYPVDEEWFWQQTKYQMLYYEDYKKYKAQK